MANVKTAISLQQLTLFRLWPDLHRWTPGGRRIVVPVEEQHQPALVPQLYDPDGPSGDVGTDRPLATTLFNRQVFQVQ